MRGLVERRGAEVDAAQRARGAFKRGERRVARHRDVVHPAVGADGGVDYVAMARDPAFAAFERAASALRRVDLRAAPLDEPAHRTAFCLNAYNVCVVHAFVRRGVPSMCGFGANALQDAPSRAATTPRVIITSRAGKRRHSAGRKGGAG